MAMTRANMSKQVKTPPSKKGFSMLPEAVQEKMSPTLAKGFTAVAAL